MGRRAALAAAGAVLGLALGSAPAAAKLPPLKVPGLGSFNSVLAQGEGQTVNAFQLASYEQSGAAPRSFVSQTPLYAGVMPVAGRLTTSTIHRYYKDTDFGQMPGGVGAAVSPPGDPGATIYRDKRFDMAHIYADNRPDLMFAAGYAQAQERLFLMDVIRRLAEGRLAGLLGPSAAPGDAAQLTNQDFSPQELTRQYNQLPARYGAAGQRGHDDIRSFVAGVNAYIDQAKMDPRLMPAEYVALGATPAAWKVSDTAAEAVFLVTQFTVSNGSEQVNEQLREAFQRSFGRRWQSFYDDIREASDPEALTVAKVPFHSDNPGRYQPRKHLNAWLDYGSIRPRNAETQGPSAQRSAQLAAGMPAWVRSAEHLRTTLPHVESNALMVSRRLSSDGRALAAMGPQVGYYSPQIFSEYELHGGGIDSEGVTFPGASPWPLIGHGIDFAWSGTSANGDNEDTFVERLCNPGGSAPTDGSTHYMYKGKCIPFVMRKQSVTTPVAPLSPTPPETITYETKRSVHGPVFAYGTVKGVPVALAVAKAVDFHELGAALPFMELAENQPRNVHQFTRIMGRFPGSENWFYVDRRDVGWIQSGVYPKHARHSSVELPWWGDGRADWQCFDPKTYTACYVPASHRPQAIDPPDGFIISWNNVEARGWHPPPTGWGSGPLDHSLILQQRLKWELRAHHGHLNLGQLAQDANQTATTDLRGLDDYPWMRRAIGKTHGRTAHIVALMDAWRRSRAQRVTPTYRSNVYAHSAAIAVFDAWWPRFVRAEFEPALGHRLMNIVEDDVLSLPSVGFDYDWTSQVQKDLRSAVGAGERGRFSHVYCGGPVRQPGRGLHGRALGRIRGRCRGILLRTLGEAIAAVSKQQGRNPAKWKVLATCPVKSPPRCDQEVPTTGGAVSTPPFPWQDRGTYHQVVEVHGHR
ncbi:MAG: penicillin acylase family protein [Solirubrobacteraceae bacterium]